MIRLVCSTTKQSMKVSNSTLSHAKTSCSCFTDDDLIKAVGSTLKLFSEHENRANEVTRGRLVDPHHGDGVEEDLEVEALLLALLEDEQEDLLLGRLDDEEHVLQRVEGRVDLEHLAAAVVVGKQLGFLQ